MRPATAVTLGGLGLVLAACSATAGPSSATDGREVTLTMTDSTTFEPAQLEVEPGETVVFSVRNESGEAHEAYVGTPGEQLIHQQDHSALTASEQGSATHMGYGIHIAPFGTGRLEYTFAEAGRYEVGCHYPGHYEAGMRTLVTVSDS